MAIDERYFYGAHGIDIEKARQWPKADILDKIRSEIEETRKCYEVSMDYIDAAKEQTLSWVLEIIDKYAKSEETE